MDIATLRQRLHGHIDRADRKKLLNALHVLEEDAQESLGYDEELMAELKKRVDDYRSGKTVPLTAEESKARIDKMLAAAKGT